MSFLFTSHFSVVYYHPRSEMTRVTGLKNTHNKKQGNFLVIPIYCVYYPGCDTEWRLQNNSISPFSPIHGSRWTWRKERDISIFTRWNFSTSNIQGERRRCTPHHEDRNFLTYLHKLCSKLTSNLTPFKGTCACTVVYVDTSHENASVVGMLPRNGDERKKGRRI